MFILALITINNAGCVMKKPYPEQWSGINALEGICPDISGKYSDEGWINPAEAKKTGETWHKASLSSILFTDDFETENVTVVEIIQIDTEQITVVAWSDSEVLREQSFSLSNEDFACGSGYIEFTSDRVCEVNEGVMACATNERHLIRNVRGDLIVRLNSHGFGAVYLVPVYVSSWLWFRFEASIVD